MALNLEVNILGEFRNLTKATKGATKQLKAFEGTSKKISRSINAAFAAIGVGISFSALKGAIQGAVGEASNLEESINAVNVSFGESAEAVLKLGETSATSLGIARSEFNAAAVRFSSFANTIAGEGGDTADVIDTLTKRGADFASVFNIDVSEALRVFQSGLAGEAEPLKRFGINLLDSEVKAYAFANGIAEVGTELTATQKVQARYGLLLQETAKTQGDFQNTSDSLANALRIMRANFQEASGSIGEGFVPVITAVVNFINANIDTFTNLADAIGNKLKSAFDESSGSVESFGAKIITTLQDLTDFLNGTADAGNVFVKASSDIEPFLDLLDAVGEFGKGLIEVLDGLARGLFGWLDIFNNGQPVISNFADVLRGVGLVLQQFGEFIGTVLSLFVPFTKTLDVARIALVNITKPLTAVKEIFLSLKGNIDDTIKNFYIFKRGGVSSVDAVADRLNRLGGVSRSTTGYLLDNGDDIKKSFVGIKSEIEMTADELKLFASDFDARDERRIRNYIDVITTNYNAGSKFLIPASPTNGGPRFPENPKPGQVYTWFNYSDRSNPNLAIWWQQTWTGTEWTKPKRMTYTPYTPSTGGSTTTTGEDPAVTLFKKKVTNIVDKLRDALDESRERIRQASTNFRDSVQLSFGIITNGAFATFDVNRIIRQMQRIKDAAATFADDIKALQEQGADTALIDQLLGMDPISGATAARGLLSSGRLDEFLKLREELAGIGTGAAQAANQNLFGASTSELAQAIQRLSRVIEKGAGNTYNINMSNTSKLTAKEIIDAIKSYEKTTGTKVFSN